MDLGKLTDEILAVVRSDYKAAKMQSPFAWDMEALKARIEAVLRRRLEEADAYTGPGEKKAVAGL